MQGTRSHGAGREGASSSPGQSQGRPWGRGELRAGLHPGAFCCTTMVWRSSSPSLLLLTLPQDLRSPHGRSQLRGHGAGQDARLGTGIPGAAGARAMACQAASAGNSLRHRLNPPKKKKNTQKPGGDAALHLLKPLPAALAASPQRARLSGDGASTELGAQKRPRRSTHGPAAGEGGSGKEPEPRGAGHGAGHGAPGPLEEWGSSAGPLGCPAQGKGSQHGHLLHHSFGTGQEKHGSESRGNGCGEAKGTRLVGRLQDPPPQGSLHSSPESTSCGLGGGDTLQPALSLPP